MLAEIRIFYEGNRLLKSGFNRFFEELRNQARSRRCSIQFVSGGSGPEVCRDFGIAMTSNPGAWNILLKDSEELDAGDLSASLCRKYRWEPSCAESIFWMVEMMESWFLADKEALEKFYGLGFNRNALNLNPSVETIPKSDLEQGLRKATRNTKPGNYFDNKTSHGPKLLSRIDPIWVRAAAPNCKKIFVAVLRQLGDGSEHGR